MQATNFDEVVERIVAQDPRYHREAYFFLREALAHAQRALDKPRKSEITHISGKQLLEGIREYAIAQYGPMAKTLLDDWGVHRCEDFGEIVFNMVDQGLLNKTEKDSREDFKGAYDFSEAFSQPFLPASRAQPAAKSTTQEESKSTGG